MAKKNKKVVILGAGLAGLACAYELSLAGYRVTVVESEDDVGGLARTITRNGFSFDSGPHRWYSKNDMVNKWMLTLLGSEVIKVPRLTRIYFDNKFFHYPIKIKSTLQGMGIFKTIMAVVDYLFIRIRNRIIKKQPVTLEEGFVAQFGWTLYRMFFKRYSEKLWGVPCSRISADWIGQRTRGFNFLTIIKDLLFKSKKTVSFVDEFSYPEKGIGRIAAKMAEAVEKNNGQILLKSKVSGVSHRNNQIKEIFTNGRIKIIADEVVSTIPLSDLLKMLTPKVPQKILSVNKHLTYRDQVQVVLFINKAHITPDTWVYVHSLNLPYVRFMEMDNWSKKLSPKGTTSIVFEVTCNEGDKIWRMDDNALTEMIIKSFINEYKLIKRTDVIGEVVHRVRKEYPVYHLGYRYDLERLKEYLKRFVNLQIAGRNGIFRYNNMDHSIEMGLYAAWNIIEGGRKFDIESVNIEREYLEEKKVKLRSPELPEDQYVEEKKT